MTPTPLTTTYKQTPITITTDIYLPPPPSTPTAYPVLLMIHGGAFMLGDKSLISVPQVTDCLSRGWIVVSSNHRLCPSVDISDGPLADVRDCLAWVFAECGGLDAFLEAQGRGGGYAVDRERVMAFGMSSGGMLALGLGFDVPRPPRAILNFYGAVHFSHPSWTQPIPAILSKIPPDLSSSFLNQVYTSPPPTTTRTTLEGQQNTPGPDFTNPRDAFAFTQIANGNVIQAVCPDERVRRAIDPVCNVGADFPPTFILHGAEDGMVSIEVSRLLYQVLREKGVRCGMVEVEGEGHTFALGMTVGSRTWERSRVGFDFLEDAISSP